MPSKRTRSAQRSYRRTTRGRLVLEALEDRRLLATFVDAVDDSGATSEDTSTTIAVLANDTTDASAALTLTNVSKPLHGVASIQPDGSIAYSPDANFFGTDLFSYTISDGVSSPVPVTAGRSTFDMFANANSTTQSSTLKSDFFTNMQLGTVDRLRGSVSAISSASGRVEMSAFGEVEWISPSAGQVTLTNVVWDRQNSFQGSASLADNSGWTYQFTPGANGTFILDHNIRLTNSFGAQDLGEFRVVWSTGGGSSSQLINADNRAISTGQTSFPVLAGQTYTVSLYNNFGIAWGGQFGVYDRETMDAAFNFRVVAAPASDTAMVTVTVAPVNDPPVANDDNIATTEDTAVNVFVLGNDVEVDGDNRTILAVSQPLNGVATIGVTAPFIRYTPNPGFSGSDSFTYTLSDGKGATDTATVTVAVAAVNDPPVAENLQYATNEDAAVSGQVSATDEDSTTLTFDRVAGPYHGVASFNSLTGQFTYTPNTNYHGSDFFTYVSSDGTAGSQPATVSISIAPVNDSPIASLWQHGTAEDTPLNEFLRASDVDGDALTYSIVQTPGFGTVQVNPATGTFTYTPNLNYSGTDSFTFRVNDGTVDSAPARVFVTVRAVNDPPVSQSQQIVTDEDTPKSGLLVATDVDSTTRTYSIVTPPAHGTILNFSPNTGSFTYVPAANYSGADFFRFTASDGSAVSSPSTVQITVNPVSDAPIAVDDAVSTDEDTPVNIPVLGNDLEVDGDSLAVIAVTQPANGSAAMDGNGVLTYTPNPNFNGVESFEYTLRDSTGTVDTATVTITVVAVNDPPIAGALAVATNEDTPASIQLIASDSDDTALTFSIKAQPSHGTLLDFNSSTGTLTYVPAANYFGPDLFTIAATDGSGATVESTVSIVVAPTNDAPVAVGQTATTDEDQAVAGQLSANDPENSSLTYTLASLPAHGTLTAFNPATGAYIYAPNANFNGTDTFSFVANDGAADSESATVELRIATVNDLPSATDAVFTLAEDAGLGVVLGTVSGTDIDDLALSYALSGTDSAAFSINAQTGRISVANSALIDFEAKPTLQFLVTVTDPAGGKATANMRVNVTDVAELAIDILPGDASNRIDLGSSTVSVALLATSSFDPFARIDLGSLRLKSPTATTGASVTSHPKQGFKYERRDVNGDGRLDLVISFDTSDTGLKAGDTKLQLAGKLTDGELFRLEQIVQVVASHKGGGKK
jgi:hypothetical protein